MFSVQGYARLDAMFVTYRAERLAKCEKQLEEGLNFQFPSEDDIENAFLEIITKGLETTSTASTVANCFCGMSAMPGSAYCSKEHRDQVQNAVQEIAFETSDMADQIDEVTASGYVDQAEDPCRKGTCSHNECNGG